MKFDYYNLPTGYNADFGNVFYFTTSAPRLTPMIAPHYHSSYELFFVLSGKLTYAFENSSIELEEGDAVLIKPYVLHMTKNSTNVKRILINFKTSWLLDFFSQEALEKVFASFSEVTCFHLDAKNTEKLLDIFNSFEIELQRKKMMLCQFYAIKAIVFLKEKNKMISNNSNRDTNKIINSAIEYINEHPEQKITLDILAKNIYVSKQYLNKLFKDKLRIAPAYFVDHVRLKNARFLILSSDYSIAHISELNGYSSPSTFSQKFKKKYGISPSEFRKNIKVQGDNSYEVIY